MTKTATIIPIHSPKLPYAINFIESWHKFSTNDLFFVYSLPIEKEILYDKFKDSISYILAPEHVSQSNNPITAKKWFGLKTVFAQNYTHIGIFDAESQVVKPFNTDIVYPYIYNLHILKSNKSLAGGQIVKNCAAVLDIEKYIFTITDNFTQYWWFNEICVYEHNHFNDFMQYIKDKEKKILDNFWYFDYILYGCYLLAYKNFQIKKILENFEYPYGAIENNILNSNNESEHFLSFMDRNPNHKKYNHIKVQIQLDR